MQLFVDLCMFLLVIMSRLDWIGYVNRIDSKRNMRQKSSEKCTKRTINKQMVELCKKVLINTKLEREFKKQSSLGVVH